MENYEKYLENNISQKLLSGNGEIWIKFGKDLKKILGDKEGFEFEYQICEEIGKGKLQLKIINQILQNQKIIKTLLEIDPYFNNYIHYELQEIIKNTKPIKA